MRARPTLLDAYCCEGGASMGYHRAGFDVTGVDLVPMARYPFPTHVGDAVSFIRQHGREFDAIAASPPCQFHTDLRHRHPDKTYPDLIDATREALEETGRPWIIENVVRAPLRDPLILCGSMFGLGAMLPGRTVALPATASEV